MALTKTEKTNILFLLGYPGTTLVVGSTNYSNIVSGRLVNLGADTETLVSKVVSKIKDIDERLEDAAGHFAAVKVGDIELNGNERSLLIAERTRYLKQLSGLLDIPCTGNSVSGINFNVIV